MQYLQGACVQVRQSTGRPEVPVREQTNSPYLTRLTIDGGPFSDSRNMNKRWLSLPFLFFYAMVVPTEKHDVLPARPSKRRFRLLQDNAILHLPSSTASPKPTVSQEFRFPYLSLNLKRVSGRCDVTP
jgi:hypothetical protein